MNCIKCKAGDGRPVYRTAPLGTAPADWMCWTCLTPVQQANVDTEVKAIVDVIHSPHTPQE